MARTLFEKRWLLAVALLSLITVSAECRGQGDRDQSTKLEAAHASRLQLYSNVCADWHRHHLSLDAATTAALEAALRRLLLEEQVLMRRGTIGSVHLLRPFTFASRPDRGVGAVLASAVWQAEQQKLLSDPQQAALEKARQERDQFRRQHALAGATRAFTCRVPLEAEELEQLTECLARVLEDDELAGPFPLAFPRETDSLVEQSLALQSLLGRERIALLSRSRIRANRYRVTVRCSLAAKPEQRQANVVRATRQPLLGLERQFQGTIKGLTTEFALSSEAQRKLQLAAKGLLRRTRDRWIVDLSNRMDAMGQSIRDRRPNIVDTPMSLGTTVSVSFENEPLWVIAVSQVLTGGTPDRDAFRLGTASHLLAALDTELWLRPDQREPLLRLIRESLPVSNTNDFRRIANDALARVLALPDEQIAPLLTEQQRAVRRQLRDLPEVLNRIGTVRALEELGPRRGPG